MSKEFNKDILKKGLFKNTRKKSADENSAAREEKENQKPGAEAASEKQTKTPFVEKIKELPEELKVVKFKLGQYEFGIEVNQIKKIIWMVEITRVPNAPGIIEGIIDIQGSVIPVIDLHKILGMGNVKYKKDTQIIIARMQDKEVGIIIDNIVNDFKLSRKDIILPGENIPHRDILMGVAETASGLLPILDISEVISRKEEELKEVVFDDVRAAEKLSKMEVEDEELRELFHSRAMDLAEKKDIKEEDTEKYLIFSIVGEWYCLDLEHIKEELVPFSIIPLPSVQRCIKGVINLRGDILAVVDLKKLFGLPSEKQNIRQSKFIVIEKENLKFCLLVDKVEGVFNLPVNSIEPPLSTIDDVKVNYLKGEINYMDKLIGLINLENVIEAVSKVSNV